MFLALKQPKTYLYAPFTFFFLQKWTELVRVLRQFGRRAVKPASPFTPAASQQEEYRYFCGILEQGQRTLTEKELYLEGGR